MCSSHRDDVMALNYAERGLLSFLRRAQYRQIERKYEQYVEDHPEEFESDDGDDADDDGAGDAHVFYPDLKQSAMMANDLCYQDRCLESNEPYHLQMALVMTTMVSFLFGWFVLLVLGMTGVPNPNSSSCAFLLATWTMYYCGAFATELILLEYGWLMK